MTKQLQKEVAEYYLANQHLTRKQIAFELGLTWKQVDRSLKTFIEVRKTLVLKSVK